MGTTSSKVLKRRYERGEFSLLPAPRPQQLTKHNVVAIDVRSARGNRRFECVVQELDTQQYTQTLTKVDDFLEKMNKTSPHISSFFFICGTKDKENCFDLVFEYGRNDVSAGSVGGRVLEVFHILISALEFLDEIKLFYPALGWDALLRIGNSFKLVNQFCFPDFLHFVTNSLLNIQQNSYSLIRILRQRKATNFLAVQRMLKQVWALNPEFAQAQHRFSNLAIFMKYLGLQDPDRVDYTTIRRKMEELFDLEKNSNRGYVQPRAKAHAHFQIGSLNKDSLGRFHLNYYTCFNYLK